MQRRDPRFDEIGYWSELKLDIIREYATVYSRILAAQRRPSLEHIYVDAFAGSGYHLSKTTGQFVKGSPINALSVKPPFSEYHFIDLEAAKVAELRTLVAGLGNVYVYEEDCNRLLLERILPRCRYRDFRRALWLLDPYGLDLHWSVIDAAGHEGSIEVFVNFPVMDINRNVLWRDRSRVPPTQRERLTAFWGDDSWQGAAYPVKKDLFGHHEEKADNLTVARAFCEHVRQDAGFQYTAEPLPMRNTRGAVVYYLVFASPKPIAPRILSDIFSKYRQREIASRGDSTDGCAFADRVD